MNLILWYGMFSINMLINPDTSGYDVKFCHDKNCTVKAFDAVISPSCLNHTSELEFQVYSVVSDKKYFQILVNNTFHWVKADCLKNTTEILPMKFPIELESFEESDFFTLLPISTTLESNNQSHTISNEKSLENSEITLPSKEEVLDGGINQEPGITHLNESSVVESEGDEEETNEDGEVEKALDEISDDHGEEINMDTFSTLYEFQERFIEPIYRLTQLSFENIINQSLKYLHFLREWKILNAVGFHGVHDLVVPSKLICSIILATLILIICRFFQLPDFKYYKIQERRLNDLYKEKLKILEENSAHFEKLYKETLALLSNKNKQTKENDDQSPNSLEVNKKLLDLNDKLKNEAKALNEQIEQLTKMKETYESNITSLTSDLKSKSDAVSNLSSKNKELEEQLLTYVKNIDELKAKNLELQARIDKDSKYIDTVNSLLRASVTDLTQADHNQVRYLGDMNEANITEAVLAINTKLERLSQIEIDLTQVNETKKLNDELNAALFSLKTTNSDLETEIKKIKQENFVLDSEKNVMYRLFQDKEWKLQEAINDERLKASKLLHRLDSMTEDETAISTLRQTVEELKVQISLLESSQKRQKEEYSMERNAQFVSLKRLEREIERLNSEKENYRMKLLKVLEDNQRLQNEKTSTGVSKVSAAIVSSHFKPKNSCPSRRSTSPVLSSYKNRIGSPTIPPPPPPPPIPFSPHLFHMYPRHSSPVFDGNDPIDKQPITIPQSLDKNHPLFFASPKSPQFHPGMVPPHS